jgi:hypothetical protein
LSFESSAVNGEDVVATLKKRAARVAAVSVLMVGATLVPATAAQARPESCRVRTAGNLFGVVCYAGSGQYRASVECWHSTRDTLTVRTGPWYFARSNRWSEVSCLSSEDRGIGRIVIRG